MKLAIFFLLLYTKNIKAFFTSFDSNLLNTSSLDFFYGNTYDEFHVIPLWSASDLLSHPKFNNSRKTMMYLNGFQDKKDDRPIRAVVAAYQKRGDHNIVMLNWEKIAGGRYVFDAIPNMIRYGDVLAEAIIKMTYDGFNLKNLHVVAHSLGGQLAGLLGRKIMSKTNKKLRIKRITALDPAGPIFYPSIFVEHLNKNDAEMVDVIHTDSWIYGAPVSTGTVDFFPNGKKLYQIGCPSRNFKLFSDRDLCSHNRAIRFWTESVVRMNEKVFHAQKCESWSMFKKGKCRNYRSAINMGIDCPHGATGDYFLQTNLNSPFSRGMKGMKFT